MNTAEKTTRHGVHRNEFQIRESLCTKMYANKNLNSIRNYILSVLLLMCLGSTVEDITGGQSLMLGVRYIMIGFGQFHIVLLLWCCMFATVLLIHPAICFWAKIHTHLTSTSKSYWNQLCLLMLMLFLTYFIYYPAYYTKIFNLPIASSIVVIMEQVRMLMKMHAYIRSIVSQILWNRENYKQVKPVFQNFFFFLFAPTLIYKDEYPRTQNIRWKFVFINFTEVIAYIFLISLLTSSFIEPNFKNFGLEPYSFIQIYKLTYTVLVPSFIAFILAKYIILHSWMNACAEMLRFGDREFYSDWWNAYSYPEYYRKWNTLVHNYLHTYIYQDIYKIIIPGNQILAKGCVIITSAIIHEYVLSVVLGVFIPILFIQFGIFGQIFLYVKFYNEFIGNVFIWTTFSLGIGIETTFYIIEYYTRINCPIEYKTFSDFFVPRILSHC